MLNQTVWKPILLAFYLFLVSRLGHADDAWVGFETRTDASLRGLAAVNKDVAWACGSLGTVLETTDGGKSWLHHSLPNLQAVEIRSIHAWDSDTAIVATAGQPALIMKTVDRGVTWTTTYENKSSQAFFDGMRFWNDRSGIAFSDPIDSGLLIVTSNDGGVSWNEVEPAAIPKLDAGEAGFAASNSSLHTFGNQHAWIGLGGSDKGASRVVRTQDAGLHWTSHTAACIARGASAGIFSIAFENASRGVAVGGDYKQPAVDTQNIAITEDGGLTWRPPRVNRPHGFRSSVVVVPPRGSDLTTTRWLTCGPSGCDWSVNGEEWIAFSDDGFHAFSVATDRSVWAAGSAGRVASLAEDAFQKIFGLE